MIHFPFYFWCKFPSPINWQHSPAVVQRLSLYFPKWKGLRNGTFLPLYPLYQRSEVTGGHSSCSGLADAPLIWLRQWNAKIRPQASFSPRLPHHITAEISKNLLCYPIFIYLEFWWYYVSIQRERENWLLCSPVTFSLWLLLINVHSVGIVSSPPLPLRHSTPLRLLISIETALSSSHHLSLSTRLLSLSPVLCSHIGSPGLGRFRMEQAVPL